VAALALLATPWDFHAMGKSRIRLIRAMGPGLEALLDRLGVLPVDVLQAMFASLDPFLTAVKFERFAGARPGSARAKAFVALEDWLNDGVALAGPVAWECLSGWYVENAPRLGRWRIKERPVRPEEVTAPALVVVPAKDRIVPPASAAALAEALPNAERWTLAAGHIGMVAGGAAPSLLFRPLAQWLKAAMAGPKPVPERQCTLPPL
jgi:polyhydroxyalkanoate synthase